MSAFTSTLDALRKAHAAAAQLEDALSRGTGDFAISTNLAAQRKLIRRLELEIIESSSQAKTGICRYRMVPETRDRYTVSAVTRSLVTFQNAFTTIYASKITGRKKERAKVAREIAERSAYEIGYSFAGSLGVVLFLPERDDLFRSEIDLTARTFLQVLEARDEFDVRDMANELGIASVKKVHDWAADNYYHDFAIDLQWHLPATGNLGRYVDRSQFARLVQIIQVSTDEQRTDRSFPAKLVGLDTDLGTFHLLVAQDEGGDVRGVMHADFDRRRKYEVGSSYTAAVTTSVKTNIATQRTETKHNLSALT